MKRLYDLPQFYLAVVTVCLFGAIIATLMFNNN